MIKTSSTACLIYSVKKVFFKTLVDEVQELEALSKDPGAVVHGKRYSSSSLLLCSLFGLDLHSSLMMQMHG